MQDEAVYKSSRCSLGTTFVRTRPTPLVFNQHFAFAVYEKRLDLSTKFEKWWSALHCACARSVKCIQSNTQPPHFDARADCVGGAVRCFAGGA